MGHVDRRRLVDVALAIALARRARDALAPFEIGHPADEDEDCADDAEHRRGPGRRLEIGGRNDVLDLRGERQRIHGERERAERDRAGDEALGDIAGAEDFGGEGIGGEYDDEQRHAAIGQNRADKHDRHHRLLFPDDANDRVDDRLRETGEFDHLAEHRAEQEHRKVELREADHLHHEEIGEGGRDGVRVGEEDGAEGGDRREQDDAEASVGDEHQETKCGERDQKIHDAPSRMRNATLEISTQSGALGNARQALFVAKQGAELGLTGIYELRKG